jgi:hypothetical protein
MPNHKTKKKNLNKYRNRRIGMQNRKEEKELLEQKAKWISLF